MVQMLFNVPLSTFVRLAKAKEQRCLFHPVYPYIRYFLLPNALETSEMASLQSSGLASTLGAAYVGAMGAAMYVHISIHLWHTA